MAIGKNKRASKGGKRGKKKVVEPMSRKEWYDVIAPKNFKIRHIAKSFGNKTIGDRPAELGIMGRVFETTLADLKGTNLNDEPFRKMKFVVRDIQGRNLLTQFNGMDLTTDRVRSLLKKWCSTVEAVVEARTADQFVLRVFVLAFTKKQKGQLSKNCYAKSRLIKWVRLRTTRIIQKSLARLDLDKAMQVLSQDVLTDLIQRRCNVIVPLRDVKIRKVKVIRTPQFDAQKLVESMGNVPKSYEGVAKAVEVAVEPTKAKK